MSLIVTPPCLLRLPRSGISYLRLNIRPRRTAMIWGGTKKMTHTPHGYHDSGLADWFPSPHLSRDWWTCIHFFHIYERSMPRRPRSHFMACFHCLVSRNSARDPLAQLRLYRGGSITLFVDDVNQAKLIRFETLQLHLCRCCRTLFTLTDRNGHFAQVRFLQG